MLKKANGRNQERRKTIMFVLGGGLQGGGHEILMNDW